MTTPAPHGSGTPGSATPGAGTPGSEVSGPDASGHRSSGSGSWGAGPGGPAAGGPHGPHGSPGPRNSPSPPSPPGSPGSYAPDGWGALLRAAVRRFGGRNRAWSSRTGSGGPTASSGPTQPGSPTPCTGLGVRPGDRVALMAEDRVEALEAYVACAFGGFTAVHVNDRLRAGEVQAIVDDADVRAFLHTEGRTEVAEAIAGPGVLVSAGRDPARGALRYADLLAGASDRVPEAGPGGFPAVIGYTSGTTGDAKGVVVEDATLGQDHPAHAPSNYRLAPGGRCAFTGTFSFVAGLWGGHPAAPVPRRNALLHGRAGAGRVGGRDDPRAVRLHLRAQPARPGLRRGGPAPPRGARHPPHGAPHRPPRSRPTSSGRWSTWWGAATSRRGG
ncbi:class I adenylate-forming enzyme family protein [Streptosporangium vulgare]|uniref:class I adenylate-forming enzyme family protein n=1 Tax=Streptosporangium vulgare TaxID=46190 RepID=UPI0031DF804E